MRKSKWIRIEITEFQTALHYLWTGCHLDVMMTLGGAKSNSLKSMSSLPLHNT
jgi:hypothetical protein